MFVEIYQLARRRFCNIRNGRRYPSETRVPSSRIRREKLRRNRRIGSLFAVKFRRVRVFDRSDLRPSEKGQCVPVLHFGNPPPRLMGL